MCARAGVCCFVGADKCIPLTLLVDVCQYCHFFKSFSGLSLLRKMVNKESEAEAKSRSSQNALIVHYRAIQLLSKGS